MFNEHDLNFLSFNHFSLPPTLPTAISNFLTLKMYIFKVQEIQKYFVKQDKGT